MFRRTSLAVVAVAGCAALVAGCGSSSSGASGTNDSSQSAQQELTSAFSALGNGSSLTTTVKLGASAAQLEQLASSQGSQISASEANAIAGAELRVSVSAPSGKKLSDLTGSSGTSGAATDFTVSDNGTDYLSVRSVNHALYLKADARDLLNAIGQGATYAQLQGAAAQLPTFLQALLQGKWVSLPASTAESLSGTSGGSSSGSSQQANAIVAGLKNILSKDVTVSRTSTGTTDQLSLTANSRTVAIDLLNVVSSAIPTAGAALGGANPSQVPSKTITLGAQVTGGALSQLSIDLGQFDPSGKAHLPLVVDFSQGGAAISTPSGAVAVNPQELQQLLGSFGGLSGAGAGG